MSSIVYEPLQLDIDSLETTAGRLICSIKPQWSSKKLTFKKFPSQDESLIYLINCPQVEDEQQGIIVRLYSTNSDVFMRYEEQIRTMAPWMRRGFFPLVSVMFINGYFSNYPDGKVMISRELENQYVSVCIIG